MPITEIKNSSGSQGELLFSQPIPEVTISLLRTDDAGSGRENIILRQTWSTSIEQGPRGIISWRPTRGGEGVPFPSNVESVGSSAIWDITIPIEANVSGELTYTIPQNSASTISINTDSLSSSGPSSDTIFSLPYTTVCPFPMIILSPVIYTSQATARIYWDQDVGGFDQTNLMIETVDQQDSANEVTIETFTKVSDSEYHVVLNIPDSAGSVRVGISADTAYYLAQVSKVGPPITIYSQPTPYNLDRGIPIPVDPCTLEIIIPETSVEEPYQEKEVELEFVFSEPVDDFGNQPEDIALTNLTRPVANLLVANDRGDRYTLTVNLPDNQSGVATVQVPAGTARSLATGATCPTQIVTETFHFDTTKAVTEAIPGTTRICFEEFNFENNPFLNAVLSGDERGGAFFNLRSPVKNGNNLYFVMDIRKRRFPSNRLATGIEGGSALCHVNLIDNTCTILKTYEFLTAGARSLTVWNKEVYFLEGSAYSSRETAGMGHLYKINSSNVIVDLGRAWRSDDPIEGDLFRGIHSKTISPLVGNGNTLNLIMGYGFLDNMNRQLNDPANLIENWQHLQYGNTLNRRVPVLKTNNRTGYEILREMSKITSSLIGFNKSTFSFIPRGPLKARLSSAGISTGTVSSIGYSNANTVFPNEGMILVNKELFSYTGKTNNTFTGITRSLFGTDEANHMGGADIFLIDHALDLDEGIVEDPENDTFISISPHRYNLIRAVYADGQKEHIARNQASIDEFGEKSFELTLDLDNHQRLFVEHIVEGLLERFSKIRYRVELELKSSFYLQLGQVILYREKESNFFTPIQILSIKHSEDRIVTSVIAESF